ncbi:MAG: hypothetical protein GY866_24795 [Proteobacteria bacterium]|nr:hypothetical protein [Pseudomonadota bacterium]
MSAKNQVVSKSISLSERVQRGRKNIQEGRFKKKPLWDEKQTVLTEETAKLPLVKRKALAIVRQLAGVPVGIKDHELLVGEMIQGAGKSGHPFPEYATQGELTAALNKFSTTRSIQGFSCPSYSRLFMHGVSGLRKMAAEKLDEARRTGAGGETEAWYESVIIALDGFKDFFLRYHDLALEFAQAETDPVRKGELEEIAAITKSLSERPPQTFREALQVFWLGHVVLSCTAPRANTPVGRTDQYLWPFLRSDLDKGRITMEQAQELMDLLWLKFNEQMESLELAEASTHQKPELPGDMTEETFGKIPGALFGGFWGHYLGGKTSDSRDPRRYEGYGNFIQNMTLAGLTPEGEDAANPVTYLCLNATLRLGMPQPQLYIRLHDESPPALFERITDCIRAGLSAPAIYNDEVIVPGLERWGLTAKDARDYTTDGCWEAYSQGRTNCKHGLILILEALDRTLCPERWYERLEVWGYVETLDPFREFKPADPYGFQSFDDVMGSFKENLEQLIKGHIECTDNWRDGRLYDIAPLPLLSALLEGPLESGKDMTQDGAVYNFSAPIFASLSNTADSLAAIRKLCFEEKTIAWSDMLDAVKDNWRDRESLRQLAINRAPAYGNDIDYVDDIAREIADFLVEKTKKYEAGIRNDRLMFPPGLGTFGRFIGFGEITGATADGRLDGQPISSNASPSAGKSVSGHTAALNSYCKLPLADLPSGAPLDIAMENRASMLPHLEAFIKTFVEKRGGMLTISVNDCDKLRAAQKEPEKHRDLMVRVGGWQAYFIDLPPEMQDWQIKKTETYAGS